jgi:thioredoxin-related protein
MFKISRTFRLFLLCFLSAYFTPIHATEAPKRGEVQGGVLHPAPAWFKDSFLDIADDIEEATDADKHLMLFFDLTGCPYCDQMLTEIFESEPYASKIQQHFDVISINIKGDRDIAYNENLSVTEKELSEMLNVHSTPGIIFLNSDNKPVVRVDGYRAPARFDRVLDFVQTKAYKTQELSAYLDDNLTKGIYSLRDNPMFKNITDLSNVEGPLVVIFEDSTCNDCNKFHETLLSNAEVQKELDAFTVVRLDTDSELSIVDVEGNQTTPKALALQLEMTYRPGVVMYADGKALRRADSLLFKHHFKERLRWIGTGAYKTMAYHVYSERRTEELLAAGNNIDLAQ